MATERPGDSSSAQPVVCYPITAQGLLVLHTCNAVLLGQVNDDVCPRFGGLCTAGATLQQPRQMHTTQHQDAVW